MKGRILVEHLHLQASLKSQRLRVNGFYLFYVTGPRITVICILGYNTNSGSDMRDSSHALYVVRVASFESVTGWRIFTKLS